MFAGLDRAGRGKSRADAFGPGRVLALWDLEADLDVFSGIVAADADALDDFRDQGLIPINLLGQICDDRDGVIKEADRPGVFVLSAARVDGALGVAMGDCPIDPVLEPLGGLQIGAGVFLQQRQMLGRQLDNFGNRHGADVIDLGAVGGFIRHHATSDRSKDDSETGTVIGLGRAIARYEKSFCAWRR